MRQFEYTDEPQEKRRNAMEQPVSDPIFERLKADVLEGIESGKRGEHVTLDEFLRMYGLHASEDES